MISGKDTKNDYQDFCGGHEQEINFSIIDSKKEEQFIIGIQKDLSFAELVSIFEDDLDQMANCAIHCFSKNILTRSQAASFLEYRSLKKNLIDVTIIDLTDESIMGETVPLRTSERLKLIPLLKSMPRMESCVFSASIPAQYLQDVKISGFLDLTAKSDVIVKSVQPIFKPRNFENEIGPEETGEIYIKIYIGSVDVRNAITKVRYHEHAKDIYPALGEFDINDVGDSVEKYGRRLSVDSPDVSTSKSFHKIESFPTFIGLHDEVHRRLISTIPNPVYSAFIDAIKLAREKTGYKWSRELWDAMDMEVGEFLDMHTTFDYSNYNKNDIRLNTKLFVRLLDANVYTESRTAGLFTCSPYIDTTWILLIDIALNPDAWKMKGIDFSTLPRNHSYRLMHDFIIKNKTKIENTKSTAEQIAIIKSAWFGITLPENPEIKFVRIEGEKTPRHLQVMVNKEPIALSKRDAIKTRKEILKTMFLSLNDIQNIGYLLHDPDLFIRFITYGANLEWILENSSRTPFSDYKNQVIRAFSDFYVSSISDMKKILAYQPIGNEIILALLNQENGIARVSWNDKTELYLFFMEYPQYEKQMRKSISGSGSNPELEVFFLIIDKNKDVIESYDNLMQKHVVKSIEIIHDAHLSSQENINLLLAKPLYDVTLADSIISLNRAGILSENYQVLKKNLTVSKYLVEGLCILKEHNLDDEYREIFIAEIENGRISADKAVNYVKGLAELKKVNALNPVTKKMLFDNIRFSYQVSKALRILHRIKLDNKENYQFISDHPESSLAFSRCMKLLHPDFSTSENRQLLIDNRNSLYSIITILKFVKSGNALTDDIVKLFFKNTFILKYIQDNILYDLKEHGLMNGKTIHLLLKDEESLDAYKYILDMIKDESTDDNFIKECLIKLINNFSQLDVIANAFDTMDYEKILSSKNIALILDDPLNADETIKSITDMNWNILVISNELKQYEQKSWLSFFKTSAYRDMGKKDPVAMASKNLSLFINDKDVKFTDSDIKILKENKDLGLIIEKARNLKVVLPDFLNEKPEHTVSKKI